MIHKIILKSIISTRIHHIKCSFFFSIVKTNPTITIILRVTTLKGRSSDYDFPVKVLLAATVGLLRVTMTLLSVG